jgi:hypothetical protein
MWPQFLVFCETVHRCTQEHLTPECATQLQHVLTPVVQVVAGEGEPVLRAYFEQPPSHLAAVNSLDHTLFVNDLAFSTCSLSLREVMAVFSKVPGAYGPLWLALLDVAQAANPQGVQADAGRAFIRQQMGSVAAQPPTPPPRDTAQLEGILGNLIGAFPGLQDCMSQIMSVREGETDITQVVEKIQDVLLKPIMDGMRASNPSAPDIEPAISQILAGFRGLNSAIAQTMAPGGDTTAATIETMDT